jgi:tetratricopeptide (TPR) repeat protein
MKPTTDQLTQRTEGAAYTGMRKRLRGLAVVFVVMLSAAPLLAHADAVAEGELAEKAGHFAEALRHYTAALHATSEGSSAESSVLERIAALLPRVKARPKISGRALEHEGGCKAALQAAKTPEDARLGVRECRRALRLAPWVPAYYFNLGVAYKVEGRSADAIRQFELYLVANPNSKEEQQVRREIGALRVMGEQAAQESRRADDERAQREAAERRKREQLERERMDKSRAFAALSGTRWLRSCPGEGRENFVEFRVVGNQMHHRWWDSRHGEWNRWMSDFGPPFAFDSGSGRIVRVPKPGDYDYTNLGVTREIITIKASDHLIWVTEYSGEPNRRCDLVLHR